MVFDEGHCWGPLQCKGVARLTSCLIPMKWVFNVKTDGRFRSRLVAKGFHQIPGLDYTSSHAPVLNELSFRSLLLSSLKPERQMVAINVEKSFLEPPLNEEIYTRLPQGLDQIMICDKDKQVCKLNQ